MGIITVHFLFNLSLLIILLFLCFSYPKISDSLRSLKLTALFYFVISLAICYIFSYRLSDELVLDLRLIPFLIGGLYMRLSPILGLFVIFLRAFHGIDFGFFLAIPFYSLISYSIWLISPWFLKLTSKYRVLFSTGTTLLTSIAILTVVLFPETSEPTLDLLVAYLIVQPIGVAMISYAIEMAEKNTQLQQQLVKAEKLEAVEQMGAAISHEIRNPLTTAIGFVELLNKDSLDQEKKTQYFSILKRELDAAEKIIQDYLTFSKPLIESVEELDIQKELTHILKLLQPIANYYSVEISTNFSSHGMIEGDQSKFHQCFINIIKHSIESMSNGGTLLLKTEVVKSNMIITIQDTGAGMSNDQLKRLGEPYYSTKGETGTGLSMMVAYSILRAMRGTIDVQSEIGKGTVFQFTFKQYKSSILCK
ncbi:sensor histidine kinase [Psychrobacillus vulpis]|uniref:histidine kinase n=1 Tax=Psychrobacillus vulpis TaxID=2325572 RepID=A0A544TSB4_9BACI|nr:HAMP domain-containing sensor histidine kinase [Psychrobacillus vulpis]TQR20336.1 HAMP domain-containing histidine kinase [Psychrobacillus vulpis]